MEPSRRHGSVLLPVFLVFMVFGGGSALILAVATVLHCVGSLDNELQRAKGLNAGSMAVATEVFDRYGAKIGEFGSERRYYIQLHKIPKHVVQAFISAEDKGFYDHWGIDPLAVVRSLLVNLKGRALRQGASTITQQLVRVSFLQSTKTLERKVKEAALALALEQKLSKNDILELYLNKIYLGNRSYGIESAARNYFRKHATELSIGEAAMLAGLPKAPSRYAPHKNPKRASQRQRFVLRRMVEDGFLTPDQSRQWKKHVVRVADRPEIHADKAPYFVQAVESEIERKLGLDGLPRTGLKIHTTLDLTLQRAARQALASRIRALSSPGNQERFEGSIFSIDPHSGAVLAMQGGMSFELSQFNRSLHSRRRLGMVFAPVFLSLALEKGYALTSPVGRDPLSGGHARTAVNSTTIYQAFIDARLDNLVSVYAALGAGTVVQFARRMGLVFSRDDLTLALGYGEASAAQVARAYGTFFNGGYLMEPYLVTRVEARDGTLLYHSQPKDREKRRVLSAAAAYVTRYLLQDKLAKDAVGLRSSPPRASAGVATTTDDLHDAWFAGGTSSLIYTVWLGAELGQARLAKDPGISSQEILGLWTQYMRAAPTRYQELGREPLPPSSVAFVRLVREDQSGDDHERISLPFIAGTEPRSERKGAMQRTF